MTRMTKDMKQEFVNRVMNLLPSPTKTFDNAKWNRIAMDNIVSQYPQWVKDALADPEKAQSIVMTECHVYHGVYLPHVVGISQSHGYYARKPLCNVDSEVVKQIEKAWDESVAEERDRSNARQRLLAVIRTAQTAKQIANLLPEFAHLLPSTEKPKYEIAEVNNVVADLIRLGIKLDTAEKKDDVQDVADKLAVQYTGIEVAA